MRLIKEQIESNKQYPILEGIKLLQSMPPVKFDQSIEVAVKLNLDMRKSNNTIRNTLVLPHGTGRTVTVAVLAQGPQAEAAIAAGAVPEYVGMESLVSMIKEGNIGFDVLVATPEAMSLVRQLGPILGPRNLMPNPKVGTVTSEPAAIVRDIVSGRIQYRTDKTGVVHTLIGKISFKAEELKENLQAFLKALLHDKPEYVSKGNAFLRTVTLSSTMGPGLLIAQNSIELSTVV